MGLRVRPVPAAASPNPSAALSFTAKPPDQWVQSFARALDTEFAANSDLNYYIGELTDIDSKKITPGTAKAHQLDDDLYSVLMKLLGPARGQVPWFYLWTSFSTRRNYRVRSFFSPAVLDCLLTNGWFGPAFWSPDQEPLARSVAAAVQTRCINYSLWGTGTTAYRTLQSQGLKFDLLAPGVFLAQPHTPPKLDYRGLYPMLEAERPRRGAMTVDNVWYKEVAGFFRASWDVLYSLLRNYDELDIAPLFAAPQDNYFREATSVVLLDMVFGPPTFEVPPGVLTYLSETASAGDRDLRTYLTYRHHMKLPPHESVTEPSANSLPTLMGLAPVPA
jgi:hypothetical protein